MIVCSTAEMIILFNNCLKSLCEKLTFYGRQSTQWILYQKMIGLKFKVNRKTKTTWSLTCRRCKVDLAEIESRVGLLEAEGGGEGVRRTLPNVNPFQLGKSNTLWSSVACENETVSNSVLYISKNWVW
jgi:hypothetical protein